MGSRWRRFVPLGLRRFAGSIFDTVGLCRASALFSKMLSDFIQEQEVPFARRLLTQIDPGRVVSLMHFRRYYSSRSIFPASIAVISGLPSEPELVQFPNGVVVEFLSFDSNPARFDLGMNWKGPQWNEWRGKFDLVLCEQVLEHVLDPQKAIKNLAELLVPGGTLHVSVPAVNNRHGEPNYFYSGFAQETIQAWAENCGLEVSELGSWNSEKGSRMYATSDSAPLAVSGPFRFFLHALVLLKGSPERLLALLKKRVVFAFRYPCQPLFPCGYSNNPVVVWMFALKPGRRD